MVILVFYLKTFFNFQHIEIEIVIENGFYFNHRQTEYQPCSILSWGVYKTNRKLNKG